jgi:hypothetical protein
MHYTYWKIPAISLIAAASAGMAAADCTLSKGRYTPAGTVGVFKVDIACDDKEKDVLVGLTLLEHPDSYRLGENVLTADVPKSLDITDQGGSSVDIEPKAWRSGSGTLSFSVDNAKLGSTRYMVFAAWAGSARSDCDRDDPYSSSGCQAFGYTFGGRSDVWDAGLLAAYPGYNRETYDEDDDYVTQSSSWRAARYR